MRVLGRDSLRGSFNWFLSSRLFWMMSESDVFSSNSRRIPTSFSHIFKTIFPAVESVFFGAMQCSAVAQGIVDALGRCPGQCPGSRRNGHRSFPCHPVLLRCSFCEPWRQSANKNLVKCGVTCRRAGSTYWKAKDQNKMWFCDRASAKESVAPRSRFKEPDSPILCQNGQ